MSTFLPEDVLVQILSWLQPKSLIRFKCVCKSWAAHCNNLHKYSHIFVNHSLIFSAIEPEFYSYNNLCHVSPPQGLAPTFTHGIGTQIIGSCNGLICLAGDAKFDEIAIWNPKTRQHKLLPRPMIKDHDWFRKLGFGFDAKTNDYKVVKICLEPNSDIYDLDCKYRVLIFSLCTGSWRALDALFPQHMFLGPNLEDSVSTNGFHSWLCSSADRSVYTSVVTFDMSSELFCETLLPDPVAQKEIWFVMPSEINRRIALVATNRTGFLEHGFDVWVLGGFEDKDSWSMLFTIAPEKTFYGFYPLGFWKDFRSMFMHHSREGQLVLYDYAAQVVRVLGRANNPIQVVPYKESHVSVIA